MFKEKITREGQPCRKCKTRVIRKYPYKKIKSNQKYYFKSYLYCPNCKTMYMLNNEKIIL